MSAEAVGRCLPAVIALEDLSAMMSADAHGRRYEFSPDGVLTVAPLPDSGHAVIATRLTAWLLGSGRPPEQVLQMIGIRLSGREHDGGRIPDLTVWRRPQPPSAWIPVEDLLLVIEIVSSGTEAMDQVTKVAEYAAAGIPRYWIVARDNAQTVTMHELVEGHYERTALVPLTWLLRTEPGDHLP